MLAEGISHQVRKLTLSVNFNRRSLSYLFLNSRLVHHLRFTPDRQSEDSALSQLPRPLLPLDQLLLQKDDTNYGDSLKTFFFSKLKAYSWSVHLEHSLRRQMSESSTIGQLYNDGWADNSIALEKRASSAEKQVS